MLTELTSMPDNCNELNIPGVNSFQFLPLAAIAVFPYYINELNTITAAITLEAGYAGWFNGAAVDNTIEYVEKPKQDDNGDIYTALLKASARKENPALSALFKRMKKELYIIKYTDKNGQTKLIGSPDQALTFSHVINTSTGLIDYEFTGLLKDKAPFYSV